MEALQRREHQQQMTQPTDASLSANNKYITVKKKKIPAYLSPHSYSQHPQIAETSISSSATPSLAMLSLTGVMPLDEILPQEDKKRPQKMRSIEEEQGISSPLMTSHRSPRAWEVTQERSSPKPHGEDGHDEMGLGNEEEIGDNQDDNVNILPSSMDEVISISEPKEIGDGIGYPT